jgi:hypothetical protein
MKKERKKERGKKKDCLLAIKTPSQLPLIQAMIQRHEVDATTD